MLSKGRSSLLHENFHLQAQEDYPREDCLSILFKRMLHHWQNVNADCSRPRQALTLQHIRASETRIGLKGAFAPFPLRTAIE